jgi:hypothetical protein
MRLPPMGEAIIAPPMLDAGDKRVCYQAWVTLIGVVDQVLTAVASSALSRCLLAFDWILRGYTYANAFRNPHMSDITTRRTIRR